MGASLSTASINVASQAAAVQHTQHTAAPHQYSSKPKEPVCATDSASSISGSHMDSEHDLKPQQQQQPAARKLLASLKDRLSRPWSQHSITSGLAPSEELQEAVLAAYEEVMEGSKQQFGQLFQIGHMLGSGHYARVHVARSLQDGTSYAAKVLPKAVKKSKARSQLQRVVSEVAVLRLLQDHPVAVRLHKVLQDKQNYYLVLEYCSGGELFDHVYKLDHLPESEAAHYMAQLASFLAYAHSKHIIHRDLKPENMLLASVPPGEAAGPTGWRLKVIDYGCSGFCLPGRKLHDAVGTVCYVAPEVLWHNYDASSDMWSAGVLLYMLLSGYLPFDGANNEETLMLVRAGDFDMDDEDWGHVSASGKALVRQLLSYKPADRPTAAQLLQNGWVQQNSQQQHQQQQGSESDAGCAADTE